MRRICLIIFLVLLQAGGLGCACSEAPEGPTRPLVDRDGDGIASQAFGGRDCNDNDATIPGGLGEIGGNKKDDNCNGQIDELWAKVGYWRLTTPKQPTAFWDIDVQTHSKTALQHLRCLQFKFKLKSTIGNTTNYIEQWQTGLSYKTITFVNNKFSWKLDNPKQTIKIDFQGTLTSATTMSGTIIVSDLKIKAQESLPFSGAFVTTLSKDKAQQSFCNRCYGSPTCKEPK